MHNKLISCVDTYNILWYTMMSKGDTMKKIIKGIAVVLLLLS
jgi:hypothetical protein